MVFLFASIVILRPLDLKVSLTSCFVFQFALLLHYIPPDHRQGTGVMRDNM